MKRLFLLICCFALGLISSAWPKEFVKVKGSKFYLGDKPYYFLGTNLWYGCMLGQAGTDGNRPRLLRELDQLKKLGINNLRIMAASEGLGHEGRIQPAIQPEPGQFNESLLQGLDFLLSEMAKRNLYAVVFLNNYWEWTGGMAQYMSWVTGDPYPNPTDPQYSYGGLMKTSGRFYTNEQANELYRRYLSMLIQRKNTITGRLYKDDPTIMAWQLANEPRPYPGEADQPRHLKELVIWVDQTAGFIKSLDANHLVTTGNEGLIGSLNSEACYLEAHQSKHIDYLTFHLWVLNWSWFDPLKAAETWPTAQQKAIDYLHLHIAYAQQVGKPITLEEFGIPRDGHVYSPSAPVTYRDRFYQMLFEEMYRSAQAGSPMAGSNFWGWGGEGRAKDAAAFTWKKGDDYTGDPPQEPQGRNSVFSSDQSTIKILRQYAKKMNALR